MKILLGTHVFAPLMGGIESCSLALAQEFVRQGHTVNVVTQTPRRDAGDDHGLTVIRQPTKVQLLRALHWCEVFFQNNISLQTAWPLPLIRRPWVVCTATWLGDSDASPSPGNRLKRMTLRWATNVYISHAVQAHVGYPGFSVPNPYDCSTFRRIPGSPRNRSLVFLGRLVSDKGCDLLLQSLALMRENQGVEVPLSVVGSGPEESKLKQMAKDLKLPVVFLGSLRGEALAQELNRHEIMVVPSRWKEPFGIVALEGMACGCKLVGSDGGGLPDAIGPGGITFKRGDVNDLARAISQALPLEIDPSVVEAHLQNHRIESVAKSYLKVFENAISGVH
jgi:glycosyltransferase involved in cell wall biosynthesis